MSIGSAVVGINLWIILTKQNEILSLLNRVCVFSIRDDDDHDRFTDRVRGFMQFVLVFVITLIAAGFFASIVLTVLGSKKILFVQIAFPVDYKNNQIALWMASGFLFTGLFLSIFVIMFFVITWYLLLICALRYVILESELKSLGRISENGNENSMEKQARNNFFKDLKASISAHTHLRQLTSEVELFFTDLFLIQFATSGVCICASVYCLVFDAGDNLFELFIRLFVFFYFISQLLMITYFGNEIMVSSDRLSYSLFESDWYDKPQPIQKCVVIFGEYLKQPQTIVIRKLYLLTLVSFTRILNSAYSMFNILKSFQ